MNQHQSLVELYGAMCVRFRELSKLKAARARICANCDKLESAHENDGRCTCYVTSLSFIAKTKDEEDVLAESMELIERLTAINKWSLA